MNNEETKEFPRQILNTASLDPQPTETQQTATPIPIQRPILTKPQEMLQKNISDPSVSQQIPTDNNSDGQIKELKLFASQDRRFNPLIDDHAEPATKSMESVLLQPKNQTRQQISFNLTVGLIQNQTAVLQDDEANLIELSTDFLPADTRRGNIIRFVIERDFAKEESRRDEIQNVQAEILEDADFFANYDGRLKYFEQHNINKSYRSNVDPQLINTTVKNVSEATSKAQELVGLGAKR